jgi:hypothetical protein
MPQIVEAKKTHWSTANVLFRAGRMPYIGTAASMLICYLNFISPVLVLIIRGGLSIQPAFPGDINVVACTAGSLCCFSRQE